MQSQSFHIEAIVVEETDWDYVSEGNKLSWKKYEKACSRHSCLWMRENFDLKYVKQIYVVLVSEGLQLVIHNNLHRNIH